MVQEVIIYLQVYTLCSSDVMFILHTTHHLIVVLVLCFFYLVLMLVCACAKEMSPEGLNLVCYDYCKNRVHLAMAICRARKHAERLHIFLRFTRFAPLLLSQKVTTFLDITPSRRKTYFRSLTIFVMSKISLILSCSVFSIFNFCKIEFNWSTVCIRTICSAERYVTRAN